MRFIVEALAVRIDLDAAASMITAHVINAPSGVTHEPWPW